MIPHIIHYCWFGKNPLPKLVKKCIKSWKYFFPDYEIKLWNEDNYDISNKCEYVKEAYIAKKWAFVSDYARFDILNQYGGLYLDTDVEVIASFQDIIDKGPFMAREPFRLGGNVNPGLVLASEKNNPFYKTILDDYNNSHFLLSNGIYNLYTVVERVSNILCNNGFKLDLEHSTVIQKINNIFLYPSDYFCPIGWDGIKELSSNSRTIHHYAASWFSFYDRYFLQFSAKINSSHGFKKFIYRLVRKILYIFFSAKKEH